jgi:hypothetical protein
MKQTLKCEQFELYDEFIDPAAFKYIKQYVTKQCSYDAILLQNWTGEDFWHPNEGNVLKGKRWMLHENGTPDAFKYFMGAFLSANVFPFDVTHTLSVSAFAYPSGAGFGWHDDGNALAAFVFYISDWEKEYGGELLVESSDDTGYMVRPIANRLILINRKVNHKIAQVDFRAGKNIRYAIAGFVTKRA